MASDHASMTIDRLMADRTSYLFGANAGYLADLYEQYLVDPASVDPSWKSLFSDLRGDAGAILDEVDGPGWGSIGASRSDIGASSSDTPKADQSKSELVQDNRDVRAATLDSVRALMLIRAYRIRGHLYSKLDPLGLAEIEYHPELDYKTYGFSEADLDREIFIDNVLGMETATLRNILELVEATYCGKIGVEFMHIQDPEQKAWIQRRIEEPRNQTDFTDRGKIAILERLTAAETFEQFLDRRFVGAKRFGLEGGESLVPLMEQIVKRGSQLGLEEIVVGMAHRGRLNVLANVLDKPFVNIFSEFQGNPANPEDVQGSGDVKYHLGTSADREFDGKTVHLTLTPNPSHLEVVNPVVLGRVRAKQRQRGDKARQKVMGILLHGDAAFIGQGLVAETFELSELNGYQTGGTIHVVINNQIGFTTSPTEARSGPYCSEMAKIVQAPVFHVNGDDPEAVVHVARIATEFRYQFKQDIVIDMYCYRRQGHNESDEPAFTQPLMYKAIGKHPTTRQLYAGRLVDEGLISNETAQQFVDSFRATLEKDFEAASSFKPNKADWFEGKWSGLDIAKGEDRRGDTAIDIELLKEIGKKITSIPEGFKLNNKIDRQLKAKWNAIESGSGIDWATAEALAFGSCAVEGTAVRLSGQDCGRGTFSQRHAVFTDQETGQEYLPLQHLRNDQAKVDVLDSPLAEMSVLGFEYGYSTAEPNILVMWEAQFGDFANGAQVIIDQFISSGEHKWLRMSGLTLLLPHGYEGQGPEHSSARLERYLQMCAEDNMQVCVPSTPANYFHMLRRQVRRNFRKPLIVMTPKSLLRHKLCVSDVNEFSGKTTFHRVIPDHGDLVANSKIKRIVLCSGKVFYDLIAARDERKIKDVAIVRLEQLYPFPVKSLAAELKKYTNAEVVWCQEEPENMGAWRFLDRRLEAVMGDIPKLSSQRPIYCGRAESAATATGLLKRHNAEQAKLVDDALTA
jgi:2-oxoglutarate dehydrogenase E1 component